MSSSKCFYLYADGGARGNPGPSGAGLVLLDETKTVVLEIDKYLGNMTNNEAEYTALLLGLSYAKIKNVKNLSCLLDSELVVKQLKGEYKVKMPHLFELYSKVKGLEKDFENITYTHIPRAENSHADMLVNKALDAATKIK